MLEIYAVTLLLIASSLLAGAAIHSLCGWRPAGASLALAGATGFAALVVVSPFLIRLPGRATTAAIVLAALLAVSLAMLLRTRFGLGSRAGDRRGGGDDEEPASLEGADDDPPRSRTSGPEVAGGSSSVPATIAGIAAMTLAIALASLPFLFQDRVGVLGEGVYINDHAAHLYWADWLQTGFGPEPSGVRFGYPIGPQALAAVASQATGIELLEAFNGLLLAITALTALAALGGLRQLASLSRIAVAAIVALPYLAASFLAQSAFKETAMALFVIAFALVLAGLSGYARLREDAPPRRAALAIGLILAAASVFTYSIPGLAWFVIALVLWFVLESLAGRSPVDWRAVADAVRRRRGIAIAVAAVGVAVIAVAIGPAISFVDRINEVQSSQGRLSSPIFPGEVFGIWPQGDFRIVRGEVSGALVAAAVGFAAAVYGAWLLFRRRQYAILAVLGACAVVYLGARPVAEIHVEAKALAIPAPLVLFVGLRALLGPDGGAPLLRYAAGALVALAALGSTFLALRSAPVGANERGHALERLAERAEGEPLLFLGVDRFAGYWLRETLHRAPAGYVPQEIDAREGKVWQQGDAVDFDTVLPRKLDRFRYAITTSAAYQSAPPPNFEPIAEDGEYVLWRRDGDTPRTRILDEGSAPGADPFCVSQADAPAAFRATVFKVPPPLARYTDWTGADRLDPSVGGQELGFTAPATARTTIEIPRRGEYLLSLQYHAETELEVRADGELVARLPPSLAGMYLAGAGRGAYWPAGALEATRGPIEIEVAAAGAEGFADTLGVEPRVWLGNLAATSASDPEQARFPQPAPCGAYVDHYLKLSR